MATMFVGMTVAAMAQLVVLVLLVVVMLAVESRRVSAPARRPEAD
jgi:hypothetical protein